MASKTKSRRKRKGGRTQFEPEELLTVVHRVWLAGVGALSQAARGKSVDELVARGARLYADTRGAAEKALSEVKATLDSRTAEIRGQAADALDNLEEIFRTRVRRAMTGLGVPSAEDIEALSERVDQLNASIKKLSAKRTRAPGRARPARRVRPARTARKPEPAVPMAAS
ncbi:MAG TPA: phasin family protein [Steroidobacteraceae bacterium]|nr:phasin family protein [Steroidobacteraceae bacterium]